MAKNENVHIQKPLALANYKQTYYYSLWCTTKLPKIFQHNNKTVYVEHWFLQTKTSTKNLFKAIAMPEEKTLPDNSCLNTSYCV